MSKYGLDGSFPLVFFGGGGGVAIIPVCFRGFPDFSGVFLSDFVFVVVGHGFGLLSVLPG